MNYSVCKKTALFIFRKYERIDHFKYVQSVQAQKDRKHCGKRRNCLLRAISPFLTVFSKNSYFRHVKNKGLFGQGLMPFTILFQLYRGSQNIFLCCPRVLLTSTPHNILSKPLAAFSNNHRRNNGQR